MELTKFVVQYLLPTLLDLDLKTKSITSERTFIRGLCEIVVYKVSRAKVEIDLAFYLTLI